MPVKRRLLLTAALTGLASVLAACGGGAPTGDEKRKASDLQSALARISGITSVTVEVRVDRRGSGRRLVARAAMAPGLGRDDLVALGSAVQQALAEHAIADPGSCYLGAVRGGRNVEWTVETAGIAPLDALVDSGLAELEGGAAGIRLGGAGVDSEWRSVHSAAMLRAAPAGLNFVRRFKRADAHPIVEQELLFSRGGASLTLPLDRMIRALEAAAAGSRLVVQAQDVTWSIEVSTAAVPTPPQPGDTAFVRAMTSVLTDLRRADARFPVTVGDPWRVTLAVGRTITVSRWDEASRARVEPVVADVLATVNA